VALCILPLKFFQPITVLQRHYVSKTLEFLLNWARGCDSELVVAVR